MALRLRDIPALPLIVLLHLLFTLSSLLVRIAEGLQRQEPPSAATKPARHIALVLSTPPNAVKRSTSVARNAQRRRAVVESVQRLVAWASEAGTTELSIWDGHGLLQRYREDIDKVLLRASPAPDSDPATPTPNRSSLPAQDLSQDVRLFGPFSQDPTAHLQVSKSHASTSTVYGVTAKPITLHLLEPSATDLVAEITRRYIDQDRSPENITQKSLDTDVRNALEFKDDPDLLIVHPIESPSFLRALLPRPAPELHGYPFWPLRITEIYQHRTPLPIPASISSLLAMLLSRAQHSALPLVRKTARLISLDDPQAVFRRVPGALSPAEWEGAMSAWGKVEQRLGR